MAAAVQARLRQMLLKAGFEGCGVVACCVETDPFRYLS
jgi:hypothetical protein